MKKISVGLADVTILGGWPVDRRTSQFDYEHVDHVPVMVEEDVPSYLHVENYVDMDGDVRERSWVEYERQERQVGSYEVRSPASLTHTICRIRFDNGQLSPSFTALRQIGRDTRCHSISVRHPLVRGTTSYWLASGEPIYRRGGWWRTLVTARAARTAAMAIRDERQSILKEIPLRSPLFKRQGIHGGWHVCEGHWHSQSGQILTPEGALPLPGPTDSLKDGEIVIATVEYRRSGIRVEQWISAGTTDRPWRRSLAPVMDYVRRWSWMAAVLSFLLGLSAFAFLSNHQTMALLPAGLAGYVVYSRLTRDVSTSERYDSRASVLSRSMTWMREMLWSHARRAHDRKLGW